MNPVTRRCVLVIFCLALASCANPLVGSAEPPATEEAAATGSFRAGAAAIEITPKTFPRIIAGSFLEQQASQVSSPLFARSFVLDDGADHRAIDERRGRSARETVA